MFEVVESQAMKQSLNSIKTRDDQQIHPVSPTPGNDIKSIARGSWWRRKVVPPPNTQQLKHHLPHTNTHMNSHEHTIHECTQYKPQLSNLKQKQHRRKQTRNKVSTSNDYGELGVRYQSNGQCLGVKSKRRMGRYGGRGGEEVGRYGGKGEKGG